MIDIPKLHPFKVHSSLVNGNVQLDNFHCTVLLTSTTLHPLTSTLLFHWSYWRSENKASSGSPLVNKMKVSFILFKCLSYLIRFLVGNLDNKFVRINSILLKQNWITHHPATERELWALVKSWPILGCFTIWSAFLFLHVVWDLSFLASGLLRLPLLEVSISKILWDFHIVDINSHGSGDGKVLVCFLYPGTQSRIGSLVIGSKPLFSGFRESTLLPLWGPVRKTQVVWEWC